MKTIIEPFKIKSVEPINMNSVDERREIISKAYYNLFLLQSANILPFGFFKIAFFTSQPGGIVQPPQVLPEGYPKICNFL